MSEENEKPKKEAKIEYCYSKKWHHNDGSFGWIYFLGVIGTAVYYIQQVSGFWLVILAILKAFVWPAFLLYKVFQMLGM